MNRNALAARATFLAWRLGRVSDDASVAAGSLEGVSLVAAREGSPSPVAFDDPGRPHCRPLVAGLEPLALGLHGRLGQAEPLRNLGRRRSPSPGPESWRARPTRSGSTPTATRSRSLATGGARYGSRHRSAWTTTGISLRLPTTGRAARNLRRRQIAGERPRRSSPRAQRTARPDRPGRRERGPARFCRTARRRLVLDQASQPSPGPSANMRRLPQASGPSTPTVIVTTPASASRTTDSTPIFAGSASTGALDRPAIEVRLYRGRSSSGAPFRIMAARPAPAGSWSVSARPPLPTGTYTVRALQTRGTGDEARSAPATFTVVRSLPSGRPILAGAGDVADCTDTGHLLTAELLAETPDATVQTFGDNAYPHGSSSDFDDCYDRSWAW